VDECKPLVWGYPTIKYFTGATSAQGDAYNGGRDYDAMSAWVGPLPPPASMLSRQCCHVSAVTSCQRLHTPSVLSRQCCRAKCCAVTSVVSRQCCRDSVVPSRQ